MGEFDVKSSPFLKELIAQVRALDQFGNWDNKDDGDILAQKYVKTKEDLANLPIIADIDEMLIKDIRLIFQALAVAFERKTTLMANVVLEMSHEGFGRGILFANGVILADKTFRDAHRFGYPTLEKLAAEGDKMLERAFANYEKFKPCIKG